MDIQIEAEEEEFDKQAASFMLDISQRNDTIKAQKTAMYSTKHATSQFYFPYILLGETLQRKKSNFYRS
jgi:hypothetical protein